MSPVEERVARFARHTSSDLNRHGAKVLDDAAQGGVVLDATANRPELVLIPATEWTRMHDLATAGRIVADALTDVAMILAGEPVREPRIAWLSALDRDDLRAFATEVAAAARLSMETDNAEPLHNALHAWKSTAEYELAGAPLSHEVNWDAVVLLSRPAAEGT
jgi:hypothetical protein